MSTQDYFELLKQGKIAKGSIVEVNGLEGPQKIFKIGNIDEESKLFTFRVTNNDEELYSFDLTKFVSLPVIMENPFEGIPNRPKSKRVVENDNVESMDKTPGREEIVRDGSKITSVELENSNVSEDSGPAELIEQANQSLTTTINSNQQKDILSSSGDYPIDKAPTFFNLNPAVSDYLNKYLQKKINHDPLINESIQLLQEYKLSLDKDLIAETIIKLTTKLESLI